MTTKSRTTDDLGEKRATSQPDVRSGCCNSLLLLLAAVGGSCLCRCSGQGVTKKKAPAALPRCVVPLISRLLFLSLSFSPSIAPSTLRLTTPSIVPLYALASSAGLFSYFVCHQNIVRLGWQQCFDDECQRRCALPWPLKGPSIAPAPPHPPNRALRSLTMTISYPTLDVTSMPP